MTASVLQHAGLVAVCFNCGAEKQRVFGACPACGVLPQRDDEIRESIVLSRYLNSEQLLSRVVTEGAPELLIKACSKSDMQAIDKTLSDPQMRCFLQLPSEEKSPASLMKTASEKQLESLLRYARRELAEEKYPTVEASLDSVDQLSLWAKNERLILALRHDVKTVSADVLVEAVVDLAERCHAIDDAEIQRYLAQIELSVGKQLSDDRRRLWKAYEQSLLDRIVESLEQVSSDELIALFLRLELATVRRRDKQPLPLIKALIGVYKQYAIETLRQESDNAARLISAIRRNSAEPSLSTLMVSALESLVANWRKVAMPLGGVVADLEVSSIRRELQSLLQDVADHLADECPGIDLSERTSRLALELM